MAGQTYAAFIQKVYATPALRKKVDGKSFADRAKVIAKMYKALSKKDMAALVKKAQKF